MQAIGDRLREARMRQKIDIADVEAATKIRAKYLRALENEEFGLLPGPTFAKTFLRSYAEYLGLDGQLLVEEYRVQHEPRGEEFAPIRPNRGRPAPRDRRDRRPRRGPPGPGVAIGAVVVVLLVLLFALGSIGGGGSDNKGGSGQQSSDTTPAQTAKETAAQRKKRLKAEKKKAAADKRAALLKKPISLKIAPAVPIYACIVDSSGGTVFVGTVSAAQTFKAKKRMQINLGRSTSVTVTVDGKKLSIPPGSVPVGYDLRKGKKPKPLTTRPTCA